MEDSSLVRVDEAFGLVGFDPSRGIRLDVQCFAVESKGLEDGTLYGVGCIVSDSV